MVSGVTSINPADQVGVDFRFQVNDAIGIRISNETWRCPQAWDSQLSVQP